MIALHRARHRFSVFFREGDACDPFGLLDEFGGDLSRLLGLRGEGSLKGDSFHADAGEGGEKLAAGEGPGCLAWGVLWATYFITPRKQLVSQRKGTMP